MNLIDCADVLELTHKLIVIEDTEYPCSHLRVKSSVRYRSNEVLDLIGVELVESQSKVVLRQHL